jgi:hypothetical protein
MLKTYSREELKQLEGKRVRCSFESFLYENTKTTYEGILDMSCKSATIGNKQVAYSDSVGICKFELLENEFEVGEEVEVRDEEDGIRQPRIYLCTVP